MPADHTMPMVRVEPALADPRPGDSFLYIVTVRDEEQYAHSPWEALDLAKAILNRQDREENG